MLNLFESYTDETAMLYNSLQTAGFTQATVVVEDNGFLPDEVESPYKYYIEKTEPLKKGKPLFFNQVKIPKYWEIIGDSKEAGIYDLGKKRANINYTEPKDRRLVKEVAWLDDKQNIRLVEHYNKYGWCYAKTSYNLRAEPITTAYFTASGKEIIVENHVTKDITLAYAGKIYNFPSKTDFVVHYLKLRKFDLERIFYNSLAVPFFVVLRLSSEMENQALLFWQEAITEKIPDNMKMILNAEEKSTQKIILTDRIAYLRLRKLVPINVKSRIKQLGYIYKIVRKNQLRPVTLTLTDTDQVEKLEELVSSTPEVTFNVAALTDMSNKLLRLLKYPNIVLYPNANTQRLKILWDEADIYLDINHSNEVRDATRRAFENNMLILGFENTVHRPQLINEENVYAVSDAQLMGKKLQKIAQTPEFMEKLLKNQEEYSDEMNISKYQEVLK
ncbi:accessory Sec system glycosylation chaperone GtfB [Ligilactobacillus sp. WILCCON 0076]|uniref:UDP-N-acetylglucosamine--peptide N-acetylglucosaminyltransferase stabilizing protein GtfB n=1 Tax=Ligilactobacillus ubinensis TaxID=2876789 RepID=A0A9X2FG37_9LACO|nr:accessory Sec system glycosylation chaperone GtfB [Ligilactobacillus ubinensis]MCP0885842.1 accessory Sec system glycosylation chaperone GtfB [Ligilactobacillus ubinensis]